MSVHVGRKWADIQTESTISSSQTDCATINNAADLEQLFKGIEEFREHLGGELTITLIEGIGLKKDVHQIDLDKMKKSVTALNKKAKLNPVQ